RVEKETDMTNDQRTASATVEAEDILDPVVHALRHVLYRAMNEVSDAERQVANVSRVASVAVQAARARHAIGESGIDNLMEYLNPLLEDLDRQAASTSTDRALTIGEGKDTP